MNLAVIPARSGSKRIPKKNIKPFHGKPIIAYSIEAALKSQCFDQVIVSTDSEEIAGIAKQYGADVPFIRPKELADDFTGTVAVTAHAIAEMKKQNDKIDNVCCIYATSPFLRIQDLQRGFQALIEKQVEYSFSATSFSYPIQRAIKLDDHQKVSMFYPEYESARSQDLVEAYHDAGQFYWGKIDAFLAQKPVFTGNSHAVVLPRQCVQDIDTIEDWEQAELQFCALQNKPEITK